MKLAFTQRLAETFPVGVHSDLVVKGLCVRVRVQGRITRSWMLRRKVNNKRYDFGLGSVEKVPLAKARAEALRLNALTPSEFVAEIARLRAPAEDLTAKAKTFRQCCDEFVAWNIDVGNWQEMSKSHRTFECRMRLHVWDFIGDIPINLLTPSHVAEVAKAAWDKPDIVERCLSLTKKVYDWAKAKGYTDRDNPADRKGALQFLLPNNKHVKQNRGALSPRQLPDFFAASMGERQTISRQCFEFSILTATRSQTARGARWDQINWEEKIWTIPPDQLKVKSNGGLVVPLAPKVIEFLKGIDREHEGLIFPGGRDGKVMSDAMISRLVKLTPGNWKDEAESVKRGVDVRPTQHGIARATFMTWSQDDSLGNDRRFDVRVAHLCLHHKLDDGYNGAYERQTLFLRRRELMEAWADFCFSKVATTTNK